jgi:regulator of sigma E protease
MDILIQAGAFILSLSLLIVLHELGHFIPAKLFKTKVEKFYLFFDPYFSLFKKKIGETEYGIGWLPLGGYVKIAGMIDESMDKTQMAEPPKPWEFRSKPAWQRLIIMLGGVTVNVLLAIVIYTGMMMYYGEETLPTANLTWGIDVDSTGEALGFKDGDQVLQIDGKEITYFNEIGLELLLGDGGEVTVLRDGEEVNFTISSEEKGKIIANKEQLFSFRFPYVIGGFADTTTAKSMGFEIGDSIVGIGGEPAYFANEVHERIPNYAGDTVAFDVYRNSQLLSVNAWVSDSGKVGIMARNPLDFNYIKTSAKTYGFVEAIPAGFRRSGKVLTDYVRQFRLIADTKTGAYKEVGGFGMIYKQFDNMTPEKFWGLTAFLSIMLAFLNILPIPALDGGHVVFVLGEMITGRKPSEKVLERAQIVGFIILLALLVYANGNDLLKWIMSLGG